VVRDGGGGGARVPRLVEVELAEAAARAEHAVLRPLERRGAAGLGEGVGVERREAVHVGVVDGDPGRVEHVAVGVQVLDVLGQSARGLEDDGQAGRLRLHLERLEPAAVREVEPVLRGESEDEAIGKPGAGDGRAADVLDEPDIAV
jgi:hypothetical protein